MTQVERRYSSQYGQLSTDAPRLKSGEAAYSFTGYVVRWGAISEDLGGFREKISRGAFAKSVTSGRNIVAILDHEKMVRNVLGSTAAGTLLLSEDDEGLAFIIRSPDTTAAADAARVIRSNPSIGVSFAFVAQKQQFTTLPGGGRLREIQEALLDEISLVVDAAYKSSSVTAVAMGGRSLPTAGETRRASVDYLRRQLDQFELELRCGTY